MQAQIRYKTGRDIAGANVQAASRGTFESAKFKSRPIRSWYALTCLAFLGVCAKFASGDLTVIVKSCPRGKTASKSLHHLTSTPKHHFPYADMAPTNIVKMFPTLHVTMQDTTVYADISYDTNNRYSVILQSYSLPREANMKVKYPGKHAHLSEERLQRNETKSNVCKDDGYPLYPALHYNNLYHPDNISHRHATHYSSNMANKDNKERHKDHSSIKACISPPVHPFLLTYVPASFNTDALSDIMQFSIDITNLPKLQNLWTEPLGNLHDTGTLSQQESTIEPDASSPSQQLVPAFVTPFFLVLLLTYLPRAITPIVHSLILIVCVTICAASIVSYALVVITRRSLGNV